MCGYDIHFVDDDEGSPTYHQTILTMRTKAPLTSEMLFAFEPRGEEYIGNHRGLWAQSSPPVLIASDDYQYIQVMIKRVG